MYENQTFSYFGSYWFLVYIYWISYNVTFVESIGNEYDIGDFLVYHYIKCVFYWFSAYISVLHSMGNLAISIPVITEQAIVYPLVGYYIDKHIETISNKEQRIFAVMSIVSMFSSIVVSISSLLRGSATQSYFGLFQIYMVIFIFGLAYKVFANYI